MSSSVDHLCFEQVRQLPPASLLHQHQPRFLPQTPGFVASEIWICGGGNLDFSAQKSNFVELRIPEEATFQLSVLRGVSLSLFKTVSQSRLEMKIEDEISGCQAVSIKPHSGLTNKVEAGEKHPNAPPSRNLNVLPQKTLNVIDLCVLFSQQG